MGLEQRAAQLSHTEVQTALAGELTAHLVDGRAMELVASYPELGEHLDRFRSAFLQAIDYLIENDETFRADAADWDEERGITDQLGAVGAGIRTFLAQRVGEQEAAQRLRAEIRQKRARVLRRDGPETTGEALLRLGRVFKRDVLGRRVEPPKFPKDERELESREERLGHFVGELQRLRKDRGMLESRQQQRRIERAAFEKSVVIASAAWVAQQPEHALAYGLLFPERIGSFLDVYWTRVRGNPKPEEISSYLDWLVEEAAAAGVLEKLVSWMGGTPFVEEREALRLAVSYEKSDREPAQYNRVLREISAAAVRNWNVRDSSADPFRTQAREFLRADLHDQWNEYGLHRAEGKRTLSLPFAVVQAREAEAVEPLGLGEKLGDCRVIIQLPNGVELDHENFTGEDLGMEEVEQGDWDIFAHELRKVMRKLRADPRASRSYERPAGVVRGDLYGKKEATHRFKPSWRKRILARIENDPDGTIRIIILGAGSREGNNVYRSRFRW